MLERIKSGAYEVLAPGQCENLLVALAQVMDEAYRRHPFDRFSVSSLWDRAERLIPLLLLHLEPARRAIVVTAMFIEGEAIGWLTSLFRHETGAHGRYGDRSRSETEWLFTNAEFDQITELMLARYRAMSANDVLAPPTRSAFFSRGGRGEMNKGRGGLSRRTSFQMKTSSTRSSA